MINKIPFVQRTSQLCPRRVGGTPPHCPHATTDGQDSTTSTDNTPYYSYNMIKLQYISWIRDQSGHVISRPVRQIANTITTFAGRNGFIDPRDGLPNTTPHIIHTFQ